MTAKPQPLPPPDESALSAELARMIRVDHAGELGAARIYDGQLAVFGKDHPVTPIIQTLKSQEQHHLDVFNRLVMEREVRPTALGPLWNVAGFALGAVTALISEKAAMACTAAVEEVIDDHYQKQRDRLKAWNVEHALEKTIAAFQADEAQHRQTAYHHGAKEAAGYRALSAAIQAGCRVAIWLSSRI